jgi:hypothetical protein
MGSEPRGDEMETVSLTRNEKGMRFPGGREGGVGAQGKRRGKNNCDPTPVRP